MSSGGAARDPSGYGPKGGEGAAQGGGPKGGAQEPPPGRFEDDYDDMPPL